MLTTFVVNSPLDTVDANPGDGVALDAAGNATLRAAIMVGIALAGDDIIQLGSDNVAPTLAARDAIYEIVENSANGTPIATVLVEDPGADTLSYSITGGSGAAAFAIDAATGEIHGGRLCAARF